MADSASALPPGTRIGEYTIERVVGTTGHFGVTYVALGTRAERVALKEYFPIELALREGEGLKLRRPEDAGIFKWGLRGFFDEAQGLTRLSHPSIVRGLAAFESGGTAYMAMEYVEGESLSEILQREGRMREMRLRSFLMPVVDGVERAHEAGLLHRDICPHDIRISADGRPVLIDFAAARNVLRFKSKAVTLAFTPGYAPLEEYQVTGKQGPWTDIYSLAAVAYRAISGAAPPDAMARRGGAPMVAAAEAGRGSYPDSFLQAVDWALRLEPAERPQRIADWRAALDGEREIPKFLPPPRIADESRPATTTDAAPASTPAATTIQPAEPAFSQLSPPPAVARSRILLLAGLGALAALGIAAWLVLGRDAGEGSQGPAGLVAASTPVSEVEATTGSVPDASAAPAAEELSGLDRIALQMMQQEQRKQAEQVRAIDEARLAGPQAREAQEKPSLASAGMQAPAAEGHAVQPEAPVEEGQARQTLVEPLPSAAAPQTVALSTPAVADVVEQKRPDQCRIHVSQLTGSGAPLTYADARRVRGAVVDQSSGIIRLPPIKAGGRPVVFEVLPDGCARLVRR